ncbi:MAG: T9SS type A sorting domain-containing protein, partial [candidate division WOR-3 bacterium]
PWSSPRGTYSVRCSTYVTGDVNHSNDTLSNSVTVLVNDVGVTAITSPPDTIYRGSLQPKATVKNYGTQPATFYTYFKILDLVGNQVYLDSSLVSSLNPNASSTRTFKAFLFQVGKYQLRCSTALANDLNPINDVKLDSVVVLYIPAWIRKRDMPLGLSNKYVKAGGALTVGVGDKIYAFKGNNTNEFYVYDIAQDTWITLESIPYNPLYRKRVNRGAALAYNKHYNPDIIYAIKGNNTLEFWAYNVEQDTWIRKTDVPLSTTYKKLKNGSCITFLKRGSAHYVYLLKANNTLEFYAYHCDGDSWIKTLQPAPAGINLKAFKTGSCIVTGKDNKLYVLKGGGKYNEFWCYDAALDSWTEKESLPRYDALLNKATKVKDGASLCFDGDSLIYAFKGGNRQSFWVYNINRNKWTEKETIPRGNSGKKVSSGGALAFADDKVFALKGNKTCEFWRFDPLLSLYNAEKVASYLPNINQNRDNDKSVLPNKIAYSLINTPQKIRIYNSIGQLVYESEVLNDHSTITTKSLIPGVYFIKITNGENNYSKKLIVK